MEAMNIKERVKGMWKFIVIYSLLLIIAGFAWWNTGRVRYDEEKDNSQLSILTYRINLFHGSLCSVVSIFDSTLSLVGNISNLPDGSEKTLLKIQLGNMISTFNDRIDSLKSIMISIENANKISKLIEDITKYYQHLNNSEFKPYNASEELVIATDTKVKINEKTAQTEKMNSEKLTELIKNKNEGMSNVNDQLAILIEYINFNDKAKDALNNTKKDKAIKDSLIVRINSISRKVLNVKSLTIIN